MTASWIWPMRTSRPTLLTAIGLLLMGVALAVCARDSASAGAWDDRATAVVLLYHHVSDETPRSTSVSPQRFREHLEHLAEHEFNVWPLPRLLAALQRGEPIPPRTVAITFDDAYASVYDTAWPMLREQGWPFTVFVSTQYIDDRLGNYMRWSQLREIERAGATLANHSRNHPSMAQPQPEESRRDWLARLRAEIEDAQARLEAEAQSPARIFAWPYGEYSPPAQALLSELGFIGMAQQSGALGPGSDFTALPRYPMAFGFDDLEQFALKARTRPLPLVNVEPTSGVLAPEQNAATVSFTLAEDSAVRIDALNCFSRGQPIEVERLGEQPPRFRIANVQPIGVGRTTFNCTAPARDANVWYWASFLWMRPRPDGSWYEG